MDPSISIPGPQDAKIIGEAVEATGKGVEHLAKATEHGAAGLLSLFLGISMKSRIRAEHAATQAMIDDIAMIEGSDEISEGSKRLLIAARNTSFRRMLNVEAIVDEASPMVDEEADVSKVDPEWLEQFEDYAGKKYDARIRKLWASLLAGELNSPGTFSKKTVSLLNELEKDNAVAFSHVCANVLLVMTPRVNGKQVFQKEIDFDGTATANVRDHLFLRSLFDTTRPPISRRRLSDLVEVGLLRKVEDRDPIWFDAAKAFIVAGETGYYIYGRVSNSGIMRSSYAFTKAGEDLSKLCRLGSGRSTVAALLKDIDYADLTVGKTYSVKVSADRKTVAMKRME